jgi:hypothetical protein
MRKTVATLVILFVAGVGSKASNTPTSDQAKNQIGENATVCGVAASTHYAGGSRGTPTFVNLATNHTDANT